ncbi:MAG: diaminopimelate decarboxylase [Cyclobacteriaceae bacterium]|nr:diaminopimelate decarboxylase [Cyclobacteriaceae bacterium SS2]
MLELKELVPQFEERETPFYFYDMTVLEETLSSLKTANSYGYQVHYALKANNNTPILDRIRHYGLGVDCVSGNEILIALKHGFPADHIVLAGVGKTDKEIKLAIENEIFSINVESIQELVVINEIAGQLGKKANISIRINPEMEAGTHHYITTGTRENKFGISSEELLKNLDMIKGLSSISFVGLHYHIGSQVTDLNRFIGLTEKVNHLQEELKAAGVTLDHLNVGGGLGIDYKEPAKNPVPDFASYFKVFKENLKVSNGQQVHFELGRSLVGQCASIISRVVFVKESEHINFAILDAGMSDLMRPSLYQAYHKVVNLSSKSEKEETYDVVGPICETSDFFQRNYQLPTTKRGDLMAIMSAGAYGETMKNNYNARDFAGVVYSTDLK